jgi:hypothetical protein
VQTAPRDIGEDARVWDYDELNEQAKRAFANAVDGDDHGAIVGVDPGDVVVYTDYYLVR